ncbi:hypothetical protein MASR1M60_21510 [Rhodocyclaceae bacterium]
MKCKNPWNETLFRKLKQRYCLNIIYAQDIYQEGGTGSLLSRIQQSIADIRASTRELAAVIFDLDFFPFINYIPLIFELRKTTRVGICSWDEPYLFNYNVIYGSCANFVLASCPLATMKYQEAGIPAEWFFFESSHDYHVADRAPEFDVCMFGQTIIADRARLLEVVRDAGYSVITSKEIVDRYGQLHISDAISLGKVILNPMRSVRFPVKHVAWEYIVTPVCQFNHHKSRVIETGLSGRWSITQHAPAEHLIFSKTELPMFRNDDEMLALLSQALNNENGWKSLGLSLNNICKERFSDQVTLNSLENFLETIEIKPVEKIGTNFHWNGFFDMQIDRIRKFEALGCFKQPGIAQNEIELFTKTVSAISSY